MLLLESVSTSLKRSQNTSNITCILSNDHFIFGPPPPLFTHYCYCFCAFRSSPLKLNHKSFHHTFLDVYDNYYYDCRNIHCSSDYSLILLCHCHALSTSSRPVQKNIHFVQAR